MKNRKILCIMLVLSIAASILSGCGGKKGEEKSSAPSSSRTETSSQLVSGEAQSQAQSQLPSSGSAVEPTGNPPSQSQPGPVIIIETDDNEFNKLFKSNPIDKNYITESNQAFSNVEMIQLSDKYAEIWKKEVTHAYAELTKFMKKDSTKKPEALRGEQEKWVSGQSQALKKIGEAAQAAGGTMAQVDASSGVMDYYRTRAAQLYKELYGYDKNYRYEYQTKS
jgi:uncharacterized protein YecT (DUF1311 family)